MTRIKETNMTEDTLKTFEEWLYELDEQEIVAAREGIVKAFHSLAQQVEEETRKELSDLLELIVLREFPRAERAWCIECAERIQKSVNQAILNLKK